MEKVTLIIENLEEEISEWLLLEYKHVCNIWKNVFFTRAEKLEDFFPGKTTEKTFSDIFHRVIVLDPQAKKELRPSDFKDIEAVVIGGILGHEKPKGRTRKLLVSKVGEKNSRNLGKKQLSIDSAALVAKLIYLGYKLEEIEITNEVVIDCGEEKIILPYGYVVIENKIIITPGLIEYLLSK